MLYAGDRKDASDMISNWLTEGKDCPARQIYLFKYCLSVCQTEHEIPAQDKLMNWILSLEFNHFAIPKPDLNIFLDVPFAFTEKKSIKCKNRK